MSAPVEEDPRAVLLTWNPGPHDDRRWTPQQWWDAMVVPHGRSEVVDTSWGVARHVNGFEVGQSAWLYRQGSHGRGLVARGTLTGTPRPDPAAARNIVDVAWRESVPLEHALEVAELERAAPTFAWRQVWASGRHLSPPVASAVLEVWAEHLDDVWREDRSRPVR